MNPYMNTIVSIVIGVAIGIYAHHRYVVSIGEQLVAEKTEELAARLQQLFEQHVVLVYSERDEDTDVIRLFEADTDRFICQADSALALTHAFRARFPGKEFFLVRTDEELLAELGIDLDGYDFEEEGV